MGRIQDIAIEPEDPQSEHVKEGSDAGKKILELIAGGGSFVINKGTVFIENINLRVKVVRDRITNNGHMAQPLITAAEAESKIDAYTARLITSIEAANKHYAADNPIGTHPTIGEQERLLLRARVGQTVNKCFSIAPEEIVQKARKKTS